jgi:ketosteroid isomerase-like protein
MSDRDEKRVAAIHRSFEAFNRGDFVAATETAHPDVELIRSWERNPTRGVEALRSWMKPDAFDKQELEAFEFRTAGDKVLVGLHVQARGRGSGIEADIDSWAVYTFDDSDRNVRVELFLHHEKAQALEAAGLSE